MKGGLATKSARKRTSVDSFSGRFFLVTGASRGIGREVALSLHRRGAEVIAHYNTGKKEISDTFGKPEGAGIHFVKSDLSTAAGIRKAATETLGITDTLSGLVNNAGVYSGHSLEGETVENWDRVVNLNLRSPFFLTKLLADSLRKGKGSVVNISSIMGMAPSAGAYPYQASKSALIHITKALALDLAPAVRVNCVAPGFTMTDMNRDGWTDRSFRQEVIDSTPLKRWGMPEDIASSVEYLLSESAGFITGQTLLVDGGKGIK